MDWNDWAHRMRRIAADLEGFRRECLDARLYEPAGVAEACGAAIELLKLMAVAQERIAAHRQMAVDTGLLPQEVPQSCDQPGMAIPFSRTRVSEVVRAKLERAGFVTLGDIARHPSFAAGGLADLLEITANEACEIRSVIAEVRNLFASNEVPA